nr:putative GH32 family protein b [Micropterna sequax]
MKHIITIVLLAFLACGGKKEPISIEKKTATETLINIQANSKYLLIPIEDQGKEIIVDLVADGKQINQYTIRLANTKIDYWVPLDISLYKDVQLSIANLSDSALVFKSIKQSDTFDYNYHETYRPLYHFSPPVGWMNDPNGMVFYNGEYHLCYQSNPYGSKWQNMSWGHAISTNMIDWKDQPTAIYPDKLGTIFSGSSVVDWNNTAGLQDGNEKTLLAFYTNFLPNEQYQSLAYSNDKGRTWIKYSKNPILKHPTAKDFRDPKVFWHTPTSKWIMILAVGQVMEIYSSNNALDWVKESEFGLGMGAHDGVWECPDLFELRLDGTANRKWVLVCNINPGGPQGGSATQYFVGSFDGKQFVNENPADQTLWMDWGKDHYAAVTWADMANMDHESIDNPRRVSIAWMSNWEYSNNVPTINFRNAMTLPRQLSLATVSGKIIMKNYPIVEAKDLRTQETKIPNFKIAETMVDHRIPSNTGAFEMELEIHKQSAKTIGFKLQNNKGEFVDFVINVSEQSIAMDRTHSGISNFSPSFPTSTSVAMDLADKYKLRIFIDKASIELFVNEGELSMTNTVFPTEPYNQISFYAKGGKCEVSNLVMYDLRSIH